MFKKEHKGCKGFWGKKHSIETRDKLSRIAILQNRLVSFKGRKHNLTSKEKNRLMHLGKKHSLESKLKMSVAQKGKKLSLEHRKKLSVCHTGLKHSEETKKKLREFNLGKKRPLCSGPLHPFWKGGVTPIYKKIRKSPEYIQWRTSVFIRDNYQCVFCGIKSGKGKSIILHADHIKPFSTHPKSRFSLSNGRTLCVDCHRKTDTYGGNSINKWNIK